MIRILTCLVLAGSAFAQEADDPFVFRDVTAESGLLPSVQGLKVHAAGWGDVDGDGWADLFVGTFANAGGEEGDLGSGPSVFLRNRGGKFVLDQQKSLRIAARANAAVFADLDNDGDLELFVSSLPFVGNSPALKGNSLFRNDGGGAFTDISQGSAACPPTGLAGRSAVAFDYDGDGLLDLLVTDCYFDLYRGSHTSRLYRNLGDLKFRDVTDEAGLPHVSGLGVAAGDLNNDGWPDLFIAARDSNVLLLNDGKGKFIEPPGSRKVFAWDYPPKVGDNTACGVTFGDVNRDGLLDILIGHHFKRPWVEPVPIRLYLNKGIANGIPAFEDVTEQVGLTPLTMKAPHVEIQDFDNDGWPDIYASAAKFAAGRPYPFIFRHAGLRDGRPRFTEAFLGVNDFPTEQDKKARDIFARMSQDKRVIYGAPGPSCDYDKDGRLDLFIGSWWADVPSMLLRNETPAGHWLQIAVASGKGVPNGIGSKVKIYQPGKLGDPAALIGCQEIATGAGYTSNHQALAHFGLGDLAECDLEVILPFNKGRIEKKAVKANQRLTLKP